MIQIINTILNGGLDVGINMFRAVMLFTLIIYTIPLFITGITITIKYKKYKKETEIDAKTFDDEIRETEKLMEEIVKQEFEISTLERT